MPGPIVEIVDAGFNARRNARGPGNLVCRVPAALHRTGRKFSRVKLTGERAAERLPPAEIGERKLCATAKPRWVDPLDFAMTGKNELHGISPKGGRLHSAFQATGSASPIHRSPGR